MRLAICDDDPNDLERLAALARRYGAAQGLDMELTTWPSAKAYIDDGAAHRPDILLLDIYMDGDEADGLALAQKLRADGFDNPIILATTSRDHFADGFVVGALHYLVKPVSEADFAEAMRRARLQIKETERTVTVTSNRLQRTVPLGHILYIDVLAHQTRLVTTSEIIPLSTSLSETMGLLGGDARFVKCFRSYVVNLKHIARIEKDYFLMDNGDRVPIARREAAAIKDKYAQYAFSAEKER